jgi:hypothetical protein
MAKIDIHFYSYRPRLVDVRLELAWTEEEQKRVDKYLEGPTIKHRLIKNK